MVPNEIEKSVELKAPVGRVWRALTDSREFGEWFKVKFEGPFVVGEVAKGQITHPGYEHVTMRVTVVAVVPERLFSFTWLPYAIDPAVDYSGETPTLVQIVLEPMADGGTKLTVTESGFDKVPEARRETAFKMNDGGWAQQMKQIAGYLERGA